MTASRGGAILTCALATALVAVGLASGAPGRDTHVRRAARSTAKAPVPASLTAVESGAEDLVDSALARDRSGVMALARALSGAARRIAPALHVAGVPAAQVALLRRQADRVRAVAGTGGFVDVALAANGVSEVMPDLYARFATAAPPALLRLDYVDREIQLLSLAHRSGRIPALVAELSRTWVGVRGTVVRRGGSKQAGAFTGHVAAMKRLTNAPARRVQAEAVTGLELVDDLEGVFD